MTMVKSNQGEIQLVYEVGKRLLELRDRIIRTTGMDLIVPESLRTDMKRMDSVAARYKRSDFRHSGAELKSVQTIAQWTLDLNRAICGQPSEILHWGRTRA
jgi:hypothetical protein